MKTYVIGTDKKSLSWGTSYQYPQHMFSWRNKKNINIIRLKKAPWSVWYFGGVERGVCVEGCGVLIYAKYSDHKFLPYIP